MVGKKVKKKNMTDAIRARIAKTMAAMTADTTPPTTSAARAKAARTKTATTVIVIGMPVVVVGNPNVRTGIATTTAIRAAAMNGRIMIAIPAAPIKPGIDEATPRMPVNTLSTVNMGQRPATDIAPKVAFPPSTTMIMDIIISTIRNTIAVVIVIYLPSISTKLQTWTLCGWLCIGSIGVSFRGVCSRTIDTCAYRT